MSQEKRKFEVDSKGQAEEVNARATIDMPRDTIAIVNGVPLAENETVFSINGNRYYYRPEEHRAYDVETNTWIDIPEATDPRDFIRNQVK